MERLVKEQLPFARPEQQALVNSIGTPMVPL
jgi:hypothetical protein